MNFQTKHLFDLYGVRPPCSGDGRACSDLIWPSGRLVLGFRHIDYPLLHPMHRLCGDQNGFVSSRRKTVEVQRLDDVVSYSGILRCISVRDVVNAHDRW